MADYNYLQDIMDSVYGSQYWDQMADEFYRPEQNQQDDERLLDLIRGESRRSALPGGNRGGNAGANATTQPVPQAPSMAQSEAGRQYVDKTNLAPQTAAPVASPASQDHTFKGSAENIQNFNSIASEYGATIGSNGNLNMSDAAYAQFMSDPRLNVVSPQAAAPAAPKPAAKPAAKPSNVITGFEISSNPAAKPATTATNPAASSGFSMTTNKVVPASSKPKTASTGIKF